MGLLHTIIFSRVVGAALVVGGVMGYLETTRPKRTVVQELDRDLGWYMLPNQSHFDRHLAIREDINEYGFRGVSWAPAPAEGVTRIAVVGSSMTYGSSVAFEHLYTTLLEAQLRAAGVKCEVLNCAEQGYTLEQTVKSLTLRVSKLRPHVVLYAFADQDAKPFVSAGVPPTGDLRPWLTRTELFRLWRYDFKPWFDTYGFENPKPPWLSQQEIEKNKKLNELFAGSPFAPEMMPLWDKAGQGFQALWLATRACGAKLAITVFPQRPQAMNVKFSGPEHIVRRALKEKDGAYYIDSITAIQEAMKPIRERMLSAPTPEIANAAYANDGNADPADVYQASDRGHYNEHGMEVIAAALRVGLLPLLQK